MKNMKMKPETFANLPKYLELAFSYGTSRGRDTYGYNLVTLTGVCGNDGKYRECGGGYDMQGSAVGQFIKDQFKNALLELTGQCDNFYGFSFKDDYLKVDGACGLNCMEKILTNLLGYEVSYEYKRDRKGRPEYKTAMILKKKDIPSTAKLLTEAQALTKPVFNMSQEYQYISELFFRGDITAEAVGYYIKKNPDAKYIAKSGHSNCWYLERVPKRVITEVLKQKELVNV